MKNEKLLNEFANGFIQALKEDSVIPIKKMLLTKQFVQKCFGESYPFDSNLVEEFNEILSSFKKSFPKEIKNFNINSIENKLMMENTRYHHNEYQIDIVLVNAESDILSFNIKSVLSDGEIVQFYPDNALINYNFVDKKEEAKKLEQKKQFINNLSLPNTNYQGQGFLYEEFRRQYKEILPQTTYFAEHILYFENDLKIDGNLILDDVDFSIVVKGNLIVNGDITNYVAEYGTTLLVLGETHANNIIAGGAVIDLNDVYATGFVIGHYNDGILMISKLHKGILCSHDHDVSFELGENAYSFVDSNFTNFTHINEFEFSEAHTIFKDQKFFYAKYDEDILETYYDFELEKFDSNNITYDKLIQKIKIYHQQKQNDKSNYESIEFSTFEEIEHELNREINRGCDGFDIDDFLYDLELEKSASVKILHGNQKIDGNFCLNFEDIVADCLLVRGDLEVGGTIYSNLDKKVAKLAVLGKTKCNHFAVTNTHILVKKGIKASQTFFYYNSLKEQIKPTTAGLYKIESPMIIFSGNIAYYSYLNEECHVFSNKSNIKNANELEDLIKILLPEFYQKQENIQLNEEMIINALVNNKRIYDHKILEQTDKNDNAFRHRWLKSFGLISDILTKYDIDYSFEQSNSMFKLTIEKNSFIKLPKEIQENVKKYNIQITLSLKDSFEDYKGKLDLRWKKYLEELWEEDFIDFFELLFKNKFLLTFVESDNRFEFASLKDSKETFIIYDIFKVLDEHQIENVKNTYTFIDVTTHFNIPVDEVDMLVNELDKLLG